MKLYFENWLNSLSFLFESEELTFDPNGCCETFKVYSYYDVDIDIDVYVTIRFCFYQITTLGFIRVCAFIPVTGMTYQILEHVCVANVTWSPFNIPIYSLSEDKRFIILTIYFSKEGIINEENKIFRFLEYGLDELLEFTYYEEKLLTSRTKPKSLKSKS